MKAEIDINMRELVEAIIKGVMQELRPLVVSCKPEKEVLLTVSTLAEYLDVSDQWVYQRIQFGEIPVIRIGKFPRFKKSDIDKWLESLKVPAMNSLSSPLRSIRR
jgi:excisionase family DNA binding protein